MAECCHGGKISVFSSVSNTQLACHKNWIAAPHKDKAFGIWQLGNLGAKSTVFTGHKKIVTALCFGKENEQMLLASASEDCVIVWFLKKDIHVNGNSCNEVRSITIAKDLGHVQHLSFNRTDKMISICVGNEVWIIVVETCELKIVVEGHLGLVNASKFSLLQDSLLVTLSDDRTFKVCDVEQNSVLYHSPIISAHPFLCITLCPTRNEMSLGSSDGMVRIFSLDEPYKCRRTLDLNKYFSQHQQDSADGNEISEESGLAVIGVCFNCRPENAITSVLRDNYHATSELFEDADSLVCVTTSALFVLNVNTCEPIKIIDFREPIPVSLDLQMCEFSQVSLSGSCQFYQQEGKVSNYLRSGKFIRGVHPYPSHIIFCQQGSSHKNGTATRLLMPCLNCNADVRTNTQGEDASTLGSRSELSVLSKGPLSENSPLKADLVLKVQEKAAKQNIKRVQTTSKKNKGQLENQPVTFKTKIRSSGYTASPRTKMFSPKLNATKQCHFPPKGCAPKKLSTTSSVAKESTMSEYILPKQLKEKISLCSVAINQIKFSGSGQKLACALANHTAHVLNIPQTSKQRVYTGHNGAVQSVDFSYDGQYLLTSSKDNRVLLWTTSNSEPVLDLKYQNKADSEPSKDNPTFSRGIGEALFYYVDKFILLASGNSLFLYSYYLDFTKDDLKRYKSKSHYKLVTRLPIEKAQNITSFTCINGFYSYIVICAGSDRSLEVFDMNVNHNLRRIENVHTRNVHCVKMNQGSTSLSLPAQSYDLFLTAAIADSVKIWDLRTVRCVRKYEGHANRSHPVGVAWSPCAKYFAVGSEDKSTYIYDVRHSNPCERLSRHTDVVFDVAFHPNTSQLVSATLDGKLHFYSDKI